MLILPMALLSLLMRTHECLHVHAFTYSFFVLQLACYLYFFSGIKGYTSKILTPKNSFIPGPFEVKDNVTRHIIFTAETHNFPTGNQGFGSE